MHDHSNHLHVVLENFRVYPIDSNTLMTLRTVECSRSAPPRLQVGTPVIVRTVDDDRVPGIIMHTMAETSLVERVSDQTVVYVRNAMITYRMGVTIDEDLPPCHIIDGYLVPCNDGPIAPMRALKLSDVTTICSDMTFDMWVNKRLVDIVTYRKREFASKPWIPQSHENPTGSWRILIGTEYIHETHPDGDVGTSPITVTTNVFKNLQINSCVPLYEVPANVELPCENDTTIVTGVGTHFLMKFAFVTVFTIDPLDDEELHLVRSPQTDHDVSETMDMGMAVTTIQTVYRSLRKRRKWERLAGIAKRVRQAGDARLCHDAETTSMEDVTMDGGDLGLPDALTLLAEVSCLNTNAIDTVVSGANTTITSTVPRIIPNVSNRASYPRSGIQVHETQLSRTLLDAMEPYLRARRIHGKYEMDDQPRYVNVRPFVGRQTTTPVFRGYQVQLKLGGRKGNVFLGNYARTTVGAIVATAAYMDVSFVPTRDGAETWLTQMISDPPMASAWVDRVLANKSPPRIRRVS